MCVCVFIVGQQHFDWLPSRYILFHVYRERAKCQGSGRGEALMLTTGN